MTRKYAHSIPAHPDIELGRNRGDITYGLTVPAGGITPETGLLFVIDEANVGAAADRIGLFDEGLADRSRSIVVRVPFPSWPGGSDQRDFILEDTFRYGLSGIYGFSDAESALPIDRIADLLRDRGFDRVCSYCRLRLLQRPGIDSSSAFLAAMDHLCVLADVCRQYGIDQRRCMAAGARCGGYIALLLGKIAPVAFSVIVDLDGFVKPQMRDVAGRELSLTEDTVCIHGVSFPVVYDTPWTLLDGSSPSYYADSHRKIRSLLVRDHICAADTHYCVYHSKNNTVTPREEKDRYVHLLRETGASVTYTLLGQGLWTADSKPCGSRSGDPPVVLNDLLTDLAGDTLQRRRPSSNAALNWSHALRCDDCRYRFSMEAGHRFRGERVFDNMDQAKD